MKTKTTKLFYCVLIAISFAVGKVSAQMVYIPDTNFRNWIALSYPGAIVGDSLDITNGGVVNENHILLPIQTISDLTGVQYFVNTIQIDASENFISTLPTLPPLLETLICTGNAITSLSTLPQSLKWLDVSYNALTAFPSLPSQIEVIDISYNNISSIPSLPSTLKRLYCNYTNLSALPTLPVTLERLECNNNLISALPSLPSTLQWLECNGNLITSLPSLPSVLDILYCGGNAIISLPTLPPALRQLVCSNCGLTSLPLLPPTLEELVCSYNSITSLPTLPLPLTGLNVSANPILQLPGLPTGLVVLSCSNTLISCLPFLPSSLSDLFASGNGITCLPNIPNNSFFISDIGYLVCPIHYSACDTFPVIKGKVFADDNNNGVFDGTETLIEQRLVSLSPNVWNGVTDLTGEFIAVVDTGNYNINVFPYKYDYVTTPIQTANITNYLDVDTDNVIGLYMPPNINDLEVHLIEVNPPRPGFHNQINIVYSNTGSTTITGSVNFNFDNNYAFDSAAPPQFSQSGNLLTWNFSNMPPYTTETIKTYFYLPASVTIGTVLTNTVTVYPLNNDSTPADNRDTLLQTVVGSYDPNDKSVEPSGIITYLVNPVADTLKYTIRFQNTGTYLAETVTVIDTLDARLNPATFHLISSSHPCNVQIYDNLLSFTFNNINLPDSNANEINSHGYVQFTLNIDSGANLTAPIINRADIYFDFNLPIRTPDAIVHYVDISAIENLDGNAAVTLYPNPVNDVLYVSINKPSTSNTLISITDMQGRMVGAKNTNDMHGSNSSVIPIDVSALSQGVYLLRVDGQVKRFVKM